MNFIVKLKLFYWIYKLYKYIKIKLLYSNMTIYKTFIVSLLFVYETFAYTNILKFNNKISNNIS